MREGLKFWFLHQNKKQNKKEVGQSFLEIALVLPVLLFLFAAIFDFGRAFQASVVLVNATREGALAGARSQISTNDIANVIADELTREGLDPTPLSVTVAYTSEGAPPENYIQVTTDYTFALLVNLLPIDSVNLHASAKVAVFW